jgi:hypothetical protein
VGGGSSWRERPRIEPWPAPPPRRGPHPIFIAAGRLLKLAVVLAVVVVVAGTAFWLLEDEQGREDIEKALHDLPLVGELVPDPNGPVVRAPGSGDDGSGVVYPVR